VVTLRTSISLVIGLFVSVGPCVLHTDVTRFGVAPGIAAAQAPSLTVRLDCPARAGQGRIVCTLDVGARSGTVLRWADALVVSAPDFAPPLRSRIVASLPEEGAARVSIAVPLFAREENTGMLRVKARAVVCAEGAPESCEPVSRESQASVAVTRAAPGNGPNAP
jgi:hypothetical protein